MCKDNLSLWMTHISRMSCFCLWRDIRTCYLLILLHSVPHVSILMTSLFLGCSHSVSQPQFWNTSQELFSFWNPNCQYLSSISVRTTKLISQAPHCRFCVDEYLERKLYHISASFLLSLSMNCHQWKQPFLWDPWFICWFFILDRRNQ